MNEHRTAVVLSIDGLGARYLGPYGNTSMHTPGFNRLASRAMLFETALARIAGGDGPDFWGWESLGGTLGNSNAENAWRHSILVTDAAHVSAWGEGRFDQIVEVDDFVPATAATEIAETRLARFFADAIERVQQLEVGDFLLLHTSGLLFPWDAPYELRQTLQGDDDPPPPNELTFETGFHTEIDPDELLGWQQAYGAQIAALDACIELFCEALDRLVIRPLVCVCSPQAFPIGEHGFLGARPDCLYDDALHVPLFISDPTHGSISTRVLPLTYADKWTEIVSDWLSGLPLQQNSILPRKANEWLICKSATFPDSRTVRTHAWKLLLQPPKASELFGKPDDRWEKNDVADRCHEVVELLETMALDARSDEPIDLPSTLSHGAG